MFRRTRRRLTAWNLAVLGLTLLLVSGLVYVAFNRSLTAELDGGLRADGDEIRRAAEQRPPGVGREGYEGGLFVLVIGPRGELVDNPQQLKVGQLALAGTGVHFETAQLLPGRESRLFVQVLAAGPWSGDSLVVGQSLQPQQDALRQLLLVLAVVDGLGLLAAVSGAWFLSGKALAPVQDAFRRQQEFTADASHELRTPLAVIRSAAELLRRHQAEPLERNKDLLDDVVAEAAQLEALTNRLLTLARADASKLSPRLTAVDLTDLVTTVTNRLMPVARQGAVELTCHSPETLCVRADPEQLQGALLALLDNALQHTPAGGSVRTEVCAEGGSAVVAVVDTGEGIPAADLPRVFERFYQADPARSRGSGLGLPIARALVEAQGGALELSSRRGEGTSAVIRLPRASNGAARIDVPSTPRSPD